MLLMDFRQDIKLYTSYFGNVKHILKAFPDACLVSIAENTPDWFKGMKFKKLAPHYSWWKEWHDRFNADFESSESKDWYYRKYNETVLSKLDVKDVFEFCVLSSNLQPVFLLCYETPEKFCHRHIVSSWLRSFDICCTEWKEDYEDKK